MLSQFHRTEHRQNFIVFGMTNLKKRKTTLIISIIIICSAVFFYQFINVNSVPFKYVLRTFVPETRDRENTVPNYIIETDVDFAKFYQEYGIDALLYEEGSIDYSKHFLLTISWVSARPYFTYSRTIKSIRISNENLQFIYNKDFTMEIFANSYIDNDGNWGLLQRYTEVIMVNRKYLKYAKDFIYFHNEL